MTISPKAIYAHDNSRIAQFSMFNELVEIKNLGEVSFKNIIFVIYRGFMHIMSEYPMRILGKLNEKIFAVLENVSTKFLCYIHTFHGNKETENMDTAECINCLGFLNSNNCLLVI